MSIRAPRNITRTLRSSHSHSLVHLSRPSRARTCTTRLFLRRALCSDSKVMNNVVAIRIQGLRVIIADKQRFLQIKDAKIIQKTKWHIIKTMVINKCKFRSMKLATCSLPKSISYKTDGAIETYRPAMKRSYHSRSRMMSC